RTNRNNNIRAYNDGCLPNLSCTYSTNGENCCATERKAERNSKRCPAPEIQMQEHGETNSQRRHMCHGDVDEDDATLHDVQTEVNKQPRQKHAGHDWPKHYLPHNYFSAAANRDTTVSTSFT